MTTPREGDVLLGKYVVEKVLGMGGMGVVVAAHHRQLDERVALKFLLPEAAANPEVVARFLREARAAAKIKSEHVTRVFDVGTMDSGAPFLVMEYLEGRDLSALLGQHGPLEPGLAVDYVLQACEALAEAHAARIVHRDLKPHNLFLSHRADGSPCIKVLDFGISKSVTTVDGAMTRTSAMMGSPLYMSPEQMVSARDVDVRSDIWALGVILHELTTGKTPFDAETMPQLVVQVTQNAPRPLRADRTDAPAALEAVVARCLEKEPARRYQSVAELAAALAPFASADGRGSVSRVSRVLGAAAGEGPAASVEPAVAVGAQSVTQGSWGRTGAATRSFPTARIATAVVALTLIGGAVGIGVWSRGGARAQTEASAAPNPAAEASTAPPAVESPAVLPSVAPEAPRAEADAGAARAPAPKTRGDAPAKPRDVAKAPVASAPTPPAHSPVPTDRK
ncbi:MAG: protein kinase [Polyangiaceae bacterium]|nr:protein kinase [Polyangiaceae bacterium]